MIMNCFNRSTNDFKSLITHPVTKIEQAYCETTEDDCEMKP